MICYCVLEMKNEFLRIESIDRISEELTKIGDTNKKARIVRFIGSALGSIPWIGGLFGAGADLYGEIEQSKINNLHKLWLEEHQKKIDELAFTLFQMIERFENLGIDYEKRIESEEYLNLVRKGFKDWDNSETKEKKEYIRKLLTNACVTTITQDDLIRLFIEWINTYHETHFLIIKEIYKKEGITRLEIWENLYSTLPREDSLEADLFKRLIRDLSIGGIIRQFKETDNYGNFIKERVRRLSSSTYKSAFDNEEPYVLTELGKKFVHYTMEDVLTQLEEY